MALKSGSWLAWLSALVLMLSALAFSGCAGDEESSENIGSASSALCTGVILSSSTPGPLPSGGSATLTAIGASCGAGEVAEYRFLYRREGGTTTYTEFRGWSTDPQATFNNAGLPSGKYTLLVYARNVGSTKAADSQSTFNLLSGNVCSNVSLSASPPSPKLPGTLVALTAIASCTEGAAEYRFQVKAPGAPAYTEIRGWDPSGNFSWDTTGLAVGEYLLLVSARGLGNTSNYESQKVLRYSLADNCSTVTASILPTSPKPAGTLVKVTGSAVCAGGGTAQFRFRYRLKGASAWTIFRDWAAASVATWNTAGLSAAAYQVIVEARAAGLSGNPQGSKILDYTLSQGCSNTAVTVAPGGSPAGGYLPLSLFGIPPIGGMSDDTFTNFNVPSFLFNGQTYTSLGVTSNGYVIIGGADTADFANQNLPDSTSPNNVLAPFWTDLNPAAGGGVRIGTLTDGVNTWIVADWQDVPEFSTGLVNSFQVWIRIGAVQDISYAYGTMNGVGDNGFVTVGAENACGTRGSNFYNDGVGTLPTMGLTLAVTTP